MITLLINEKNPNMANDIQNVLIDNLTRDERIIQSTVNGLTMQEAKKKFPKYFFRNGFPRTMDFKKNRVNVEVTDTGTITKVICIG